MISPEIIESSAQANQVNETSSTQKKPGNYGKTIGQPELSDKAAEYYKELKKKFSNMDFILVSNDMKEIAKSRAGSYSNPNKMVVLIDEEKLERMATDEKFRKQYESIISSAGTKLPQMKASLGSNASSVKAFGMQVNDGGTASFFAVVDKSLAAQKKRIEKNAEKKAEQKKTAAKKEAKKAAEEKWTEKREERAEAKEDLVTVSASSIEELLKKIDDIVYDARSNSVWTEEEKAVGQHIDFRW